jgi:glutathione S-transferase
MSGGDINNRLKVWGSAGATCTQRICFTAAELGLDLHLTPVNWATGEHKSPAYLKRQPFGKIPAAEFEGVPFYESRAIARILAEAESSNLLPSDLKKKAVFEQWASLESNTYCPELDVIMFNRVYAKFHGAPEDPEKASAAYKKLQKAWEVMNNQLANHDYLAGEFSLVDIFFAPNFQLLAGTPEGKQLFSEYPNIAAWWNRVSNREAWKKVMVDAAAARGGK